MKRFTILLFALAVGNSCYATNIEVGYTTGATSQTTTETLTGDNAPKDDEKTTDKATDKAIDKAIDNSPAKAADKPPTNAAERSAEKPAENSVGVSLEKSPVKSDVKSDVHVGANKVGYWSWNVALTQATTQTTGYTPPTPQGGSAATSPNQTVTDHSQEEMAGLTYNWPSGADVGFSYTYNSTPEENLIQRGPGLSAAYKFKFHSNSNDDFKRSVTLQYDFEQSNFIQTFQSVSQSRRGLTRPTKGTNELVQKSNAVTLSLSMWSFISFKVQGKSYNYDRDINSFLAYLDSPRAIRIGSSGFTNALTGLPEKEGVLTLNIFPAEGWEVTLSADKTTSVTDGSSSVTSKYELDYDFADDWRAMLGYENSKSSSSSDDLTLMSLSYDF